MAAQNRPRQRLPISSRLLDRERQQSRGMRIRLCN